mgnify:CR=1 FL=1
MIDRFIGKDDTMKKITLSGGFLVFLGAAFWSLNSPLVKYLSLDPVLICALRSVIAGIALAATIRPSSFRGMDGRWFMSFPTQAFA